MRSQNNQSHDLGYQVQLKEKHQWSVEHRVTPCAVIQFQCECVVLNAPLVCNVLYVSNLLLSWYAQCYTNVWCFKMLVQALKPVIKAATDMWNASVMCLNEYLASVMKPSIESFAQVWTQTSGSTRCATQCWYLALPCKHTRCSSRQFFTLPSHNTSCTAHATQHWTICKISSPYCIFVFYLAKNQLV